MYIMSGDEIVVKYDKETYEYTVIDESKAPIYIVNRGDILSWISDRAIDGSRGNSRSVKREFGLSRTADDVQTVLSVHGAAITDNYWIKDEEDDLQYKDVKFYKNDYFALALNSDISGLPLGRSHNPELTNIGSREKGWLLEDGKWWLYKNQPVAENFSEYFAYALGNLLGFDMAKYELVDDGRYIKSLDFTEQKYNLQHIDCIVQDHYVDGKLVTEDDLQYNYETLLDIDEKLGQEFVNIIIMDAIVENGDRHIKNYGVLTDRQTGEIASMAPNYDNNQCLFYNTGFLDIKRESGYFKYVLQFIRNNDISCEFEIKEDELRNIIQKVGVESSYSFDSDALYAFIAAGIEKCAVCG